MMHSRPASEYAARTRGSSLRGSLCGSVVPLGVGPGDVAERGLDVGRSTGEAAAVAAAALAPCAWREFSASMVARRVLGALDHYVVLDFLSDVEGVDLGTVETIELTEAHDPRIEVLVAGLDPEGWRSTSLVQLAAGLVTSLERWYVARGLLDPDLLDEF